ncbi:MAG: LutC/YkgG family protein [Chitinophagaceae bacterium]
MSKAVTPREAILQKIQTALSNHAVEKPFPQTDMGDVFTHSELSREEKYAEEFLKLGGKFVYCRDEMDMMEQLTALADTMKWPHIHTRDKGLLHFFKEHENDLVQDAGDLVNMQVGLSYCEYLVARTGSAIMSSAQDSGRQLPVYAPIHITVAYAGQVVWDIAEAVERLKQKYKKRLPSLISLTTGPSRTADIEKTLVVGVHGPKEVYVFLIDKPMAR